MHLLTGLLQLLLCICAHEFNEEQDDAEQKSDD
jgi:hypothetical protein